MFEKQSIGGAAKQENQQVACTSGEIALDVESPPCANGCSETLSPTLPFGIVPLTRNMEPIHPYKQEFCGFVKNLFWGLSNGKFSCIIFNIVDKKLTV